MQKTFCDVRGCKNDAYHNVDSCVGWTENLDSSKIKPFDRPTVRKIDLCSEHYKRWCVGTYTSFYLLSKEQKEQIK